MKPKNVVDLLQNIYNCDFHSESTKGYLQLLLENMAWYKLNSWAFLQCPIAKRRCLNPSTQKRICSKAELHVIKTVRCELQDVKELLKIQGLKTIVLHRDPRAVMNSRIKRHWCKGKKLFTLLYIESIYSAILAFDISNYF